MADNIVVTQYVEDEVTLYIVEDRIGNCAEMEWWEWEATLQTIRNQREARRVTSIDEHGKQTEVNHG